MSQAQAAAVAAIGPLSPDPAGTYTGANIVVDDRGRVTSATSGVATTEFALPYAADLTIDPANGLAQQMVMTGAVTSWKILPGTGGQRLIFKVTNLSFVTTFTGADGNFVKVVGALVPTANGGLSLYEFWYSSDSQAWLELGRNQGLVAA